MLTSNLKAKQPSKMQTEIQNMVDFTQGFNDGCLLWELEPTVAEIYRQEGNAHTDYLEGFRSGIHHDREQELLKEFDQLRNQDHEMDLEL